MVLFYFSFFLSFLLHLTSGEELAHRIDACAQELFTSNQRSVSPLLCANQTHLLQLCDNHPKNTSCSLLSLPLDRYLTSHGLFSSVVDHKEVASYPILPGPWFNFDIWVTGPQFGHVTSKLMQYYNLRILLKNCGIQPDIKIFMSHLTQKSSAFLSSPKKDNFHLFTSVVFGHNHSFSELVDQNKVIFSSHISNTDAQFELLPKPTCFQDFIQVGNFEVTFLSRFAASTWRRDVFDQYSDVIKYPLSKCPNTVRVVHLMRTESYRRDMRNFYVIEAIIRKYGWTYENVTVNSTSSDMDALQIFSNFSLMITSHSSQLKNLVFARKGAVVVELRPANEFRDRNPFGEGLEHTDVIYKLSFGHVYANHTKFAGTLRDNFFVRPDIFEKDLQIGLAQQHKLCGMIPTRR